MTENLPEATNHPIVIAEMYAKSDLVPQHFRKPENAFIALQMASRMKIDPFLLMQNLYIIHGKPGIEAKLMIALVNASGKYSPLEYMFEGKGEDYGCHCRAKSMQTGEYVNGPPVTIKTAKAEGWSSKAGSKWKTMPELMLRYRAATFFVRVNCPEILFGMNTLDELTDIEDGARVLVESEPAPDLMSLPENGKPEQSENEIAAVCGVEDCQHFEANRKTGCSINHRNCADFVQANLKKALSRAGKEKVLAAREKLGIEKDAPESDQWRVYEEAF